MKKGINPKSLENLKKGKKDWEKGQSGNPNGRPPVSLKGTVKAILEGKIAAYEMKGSMNGKEYQKTIKIEATDRKTLLELFANKLIADALSNDPHAKNILYNTLFEKEEQKPTNTEKVIRIRVLSDLTEDELPD
jgi:hypothetical protein